MHHVLHMLAGSGKRGLLGSPFKQIKTASDAAHLQSIPPPMPRTGNKLFFLRCLPLYLITLEVQEYNSTFTGGTEQAWNKVIEFRESSLLAVCMCVYMHLQHFMYKVSGAERPGTG